MKKQNSLAKRESNYSPGVMHTPHMISWAKHPLAKRGSVRFALLKAWQHSEYNKNVLSFLQKGGYARTYWRKVGRPRGRQYKTDSLYWPGHPLTNKWDIVYCSKLELWQEFGYTQLEKVKRISANKTQWSLYRGNPTGTYAYAKGYVYLIWPGHPLAKGKDYRVLEHHLVYWQDNGYDERVLDLLTTRQASIHHRNTITGDNRPENLELRLWHPMGNNKEDWIHLLELEGYTVTKRKE